MVKVGKSMMMVQLLLVTIKMICVMVKVLMSPQQAPRIQETGPKVRCMDLENRNGMMDECTMEATEMVSLKDLEGMSGQTVDSIMGTTKMIRKMAMVIIYGLQITSTKASGNTAISKVKVVLPIRRVLPE